MKIFSTKRNRIMVLVILLVVVFFFGLKSYFKIDEQNAEAVEETKPLVLKWLSYNEGLTLAQKENKYVLIYFYTDGCSWCKKLEKETFFDEDVKKILSDKFVTVKINARSENKVLENGKEISERELATLYQVSGYPTTWFLESNHSRVAPLPGYVTTEQFIPVLNYIGEGWYESISFKEYLEKI
ncbi:MAG: thioredoxin fold domain-containing protein [Candidatus Atribacteria bacterium]|jgi:thioredoxin-related protein|nr:thioredoxin fold domain-containing protein [Candidatus Atribacteria bacterium]